MPDRVTRIATVIIARISKVLEVIFVFSPVGSGRRSFHTMVAFLSILRGSDLRGQRLGGGSCYGGARGRRGGGLRFVGVAAFLRGGYGGGGGRRRRGNRRKRGGRPRRRR